MDTSMSSYRGHRAYRDQALIFWRQAQEELEKGDLLQASEKGWGAAAQMVKAVAVCKGLEHHGHKDLFRVVSGLDDDQLKVNFGLANSLHSNFYEGWMDEALVKRYLVAVGELVHTLDGTVVPDGS